MRDFEVEKNAGPVTFLMYLETLSAAEQEECLNEIHADYLSRTSSAPAPKSPELYEGHAADADR